MPLQTLLIFLPACFALNMAPGPNNLLSVSNATHHGFRVAVLAGLGRLLAFVGMIGIAAAGLVSVLRTSLLFFYGIRLVGAAYLFYLAFRLWRAQPVAALGRGCSAHPERPDLLALARQELLVAAGNPKAILIFTAFLPQFVDVARPATPQFAVLGLVFLLLEWVAIAVYAGMGCRLGRWFATPHRQRAFNRSCAALLGAAGLGLLVGRR